MKKLFPEKRFNPVIRLYLPYWNFEQALDDTVRYCKEADIHDVLLFTDAQYLVWNQLSREEVEVEASNLKLAVERFRLEGFNSVGINSSLTQPKSYADHRGHNDYDYWTTTADGACDYRLPCLLDPKLDSFVDFFFGALAETGADYVYVDDDLRYMQTRSANTLGCFCELHIAEFSKCSGTAWTRETLSQATLKQPDVRHKWLAFLGERLEEIAARIHTAVKKVNPEMRTGFMVPCVNAAPLNGNYLTNMVSSLCGNDKPLMRPCIGPYRDYDRKVMTAGLFHMEMTGHIFRDTDADYTPEIETAPGTAVSKSATAAGFHITQALLNGMNNPLFSPVGYCGDTPYLEPRYLKIFKTWRPFFETVRENVPRRGTRKGIGLFCNLAAALEYDAPVVNVPELYLPACSLHDILDTAGLPHTYDKSDISFIAGIHAAALSPDELAELLAKGVFLDATAAEILIRRGYGRDIGLKDLELLPYCGGELASSKEFFGEHCGSYIQARVAPAGTMRTIIPLAGAEELSSFADYDLKRIGTGVIRYENRVGGRIVVVPYSIPETMTSDAAFHLTCRQRQEMFRRLIDWMKPDAFTFEIPPGQDFTLQYWEDESRATLVLTNTGFDIPEKIELKSKLPLDKAKMISSNGILKTVSYDGECLFGDFKSFRPAIIVMEKF